MVHRTYTGLRAERALAAFDGLRPWMLHMQAMRAACVPMSADEHAMMVPLKGLQLAAYHFTRRRAFYPEIDSRADPAQALPLVPPEAAHAAFEALQPYVVALRRLQDACRPFGPDWCALEIPRQGLCTAALHFTGRPDFYAGAPPG